MKSIIKEMSDNLIMFDNCLLALTKSGCSLDQDQFIDFFKP